MKLIELSVSGMSCAVCAGHVRKSFESIGCSEVSVNFATGDVRFLVDGVAESRLDEAFDDVRRLGYEIVSGGNQPEVVPFYRRMSSRLLFCAVLTILLLSHMLFPHSLLSTPVVQLCLSTPVYLLGLLTFGRQAMQSLRMLMPDMNVLILLGATAAYVYSLTGMLLYVDEAHHYLFFESAASIITLVMLGNVIEERTVAKAASSMVGLLGLQRTTARRIVPTSSVEHTEIIENTLLRVGDIVLINAGDQIPADGVVIWGEGMLNESMITGESDPVYRSLGGSLTGGTTLTSGSVRMRVIAVGRDTSLFQIIEQVRCAQNEKTATQRLADRVGAIFVPVVVFIGLLTFAVWYFIVDVSIGRALMYGISVVVIACPCAMGLATPLALMVGLGRASRNGILIKGLRALEGCAGIKRVAFDKTGTLTTGAPVVSDFDVIEGDAKYLKSIALSLERHSNHPVACSIVKAFKDIPSVELKSVHEIIGCGMEGITQDGKKVFIGTCDLEAGCVLLVDGRLSARLTISEEVRPEAAAVISQLKGMGISPVLISGDSLAKCRVVAKSLGIDSVYASHSPVEKLSCLRELMLVSKTAMVGDGINDAPALTASDLGISLSGSTGIALQQADILLLDGSLRHLPLALSLGRHTLLTIRQNLFWSFFYNISAIPIASLGLLNPTIAAAAMLLSDVFLLINSLRLNFKRVC